MNKHDMRGKLVLVTGAASGIGRATALAFADAGADLVLADINPQELGRTRGEVEALGGKCRACLVNVADADAMRRFARYVESVFGAPHVLINNAGVAYLGGFFDTDLAAWQRMLNINLMGMVHGCQQFIPAMLKAGGPRHVLNVASMAGIAPAPNMSAYAASKYAAVGLTEALQLELADTNVVVSAVLPGVVNTAIVRSPRAASVTGQQLASLQEFYRRAGCMPGVVAQDMLAAVRARRRLVLTGPMSVLPYQLKRISRRLARWLTLRFARRSGYA